MLRVSNGCAQCKFTGSRGRHGLFELLEVRGVLRDRISNDSELEIRKAARETGLALMTEQAVRLVLAGDVSVREAYRNCYFGGE